ncbi:MAG: GDP-mannose 4,6-dehydratase [SAR202 cluster bacterium]|nr:GDP-mannose 4,6-dehydratase [SAR202 cluster bacterium]
MNNRYLVTGCAGFIGAKVSELLLEAGHEVVGLDNINDAYDVRIKDWRLSQIKTHTNFHFHRLDIADRNPLEALFKQYSKIKSPGRENLPWSAVINLAARAGVRQSVEDPVAYLRTNVDGALNLLELCGEFGVRKFIQASTSSLYGADNIQPFSENSDTDHPISPYAASKKATEALCHTYHYLHNIDVIVLRYFTVYGPAGRPDMSLFRFVQRISEERPVFIYGDGHQTRDFTYVDDIARGTIAALKATGFDVVNLGSNSPVSIMEVIELVEKLTAKTARIEFKPAHSTDVPATWADVSKANHILKWAPQTGIEDGVGKLVQWYQDNRDWARTIAN